MVRFRLRDEPGWVYFIGEEENPDGPVKIGFALDVEVARRRLQTGNHRKLVVLSKRPALPHQERRLHRKLARFRLLGEWFEQSPEVAHEASLDGVPFDPVEVEGPDDERRLTVEGVAKAWGVSPRTVYRMLARGELRSLTASEIERYIQEQLENSPTPQAW